MGMTAGLGSLIGGIGSGIGSLISGNSKATAATNAANAQVAGAQNGLNTIQGMLPGQEANQQPYINGGQTSLAQIMQGFSNGTFGSPQQAPQYQGGAFQAPTLQDAQNSPGYQFTAQQGSKGVLQGAAAAGGAISGGTLKALDSFNTGLADNTYQNVFNRSMGTYNAGLQQYQAQLQGYGAQLQGNQQAFGQLFGTSQLGEGAANSLNGTETQQGANIANLYNNQGNATAAGIIGSTNAAMGGMQAGISQFSNALGQNGSNLTSFGNLFGGGVSNGSNIYSPTGSAGTSAIPNSMPNWLQQLGGGGTAPPPTVDPSPLGAGDGRGGPG